MLRVGLTGGLASGKSTVAARLKQLGAVVFDADEIVAGLYRPGAEGAKAAAELFGEAILDPDGRAVHSRIAAVVFGDPGKRRALEARIHPLVRREIERRFADAEREGARVAVVEASQLLESRAGSQSDRVLLVVAPEAERLRRWQASGGSPDDASRRMAAQLPAEEAARRATDVLVNDGTLEDLRGKVEVLYRSWLKEAVGRKEL